jgi:hypothetical protein
MDWNASIGYIGANWNHSFNSASSPAPAAQMETVKESQENAFELQMEPEDDAKGEEERKEKDTARNTQLVLETKDCEKLRKQANAKFNKGEFKACIRQRCRNLTGKRKNASWSPTCTRIVPLHSSGRRSFTTALKTATKPLRMIPRTINPGFESGVL